MLNLLNPTTCLFNSWLQFNKDKRELEKIRLESELAMPEETVWSAKKSKYNTTIQATIVSALGT